MGGGGDWTCERDGDGRGREGRRDKMGDEGKLELGEACELEGERGRDAAKPVIEESAVKAIHGEDAKGTLYLEGRHMGCEGGIGFEEVREGGAVGPVDVDGAEVEVLGAGKPVARGEGALSEGVPIVAKVIEDVVP